MWHEGDSPPSSCPPPTIRTHRFSPTHTAMLKKYFVGDMCAPYRKKITPNQDRVGRVQCFSYGGGWRELRVSMEFETVAIATPCFLAKGCSWGSLFHFYSILRLMRSEIYARFRARIFSWPWFAKERWWGTILVTQVIEITQILQKRFSQHCYC